MHSFISTEHFPPTNVTSSWGYKDASDALAKESPSMLSLITNQNTFQEHNSVPPHPLTQANQQMPLFN